MVSVVAAFATREVFDADRFAARTEQALQTEAVSAEVARRLTDAVITAQPDLVAVRPLVLGAAEGVVRSAAFGAVVRGSVRDLHRSAFDADAGTVTLTVVDAGLLVSEALDRLRPDLAARIPDTVRVTLTDTADGPPLALVQAAEDVKWLAWIALVVALLAGAAAVLVGARRRVRGAGRAASRAVWRRAASVGRRWRSAVRLGRRRRGAPRGGDARRRGGRGLRRVDRAGRDGRAARGHRRCGRAGGAGHVAGPARGAVLGGVRGRVARDDRGGRGVAAARARELARAGSRDRRIACRRRAARSPRSRSGPWRWPRRSSCCASP